MMMALEEDVETLKFLLVAHGSTTTVDQLYYQTITKMDAIHYYCPHGHVLHSASTFFNPRGEFRNIDDLIDSNSFGNTYETITTQPIENSNYNNVYLPPMLWEGDTRYYDVLQNYYNFVNTMGIYYVPTIPTRANERYLKIADNDYLNSNNTAKTFSQIENVITKYIQQKLTSIQNYKIELFIFSCKAFHPRYMQIDPPLFTASNISQMMNIRYNPRIQDEPRLHIETPSISDLKKLYIFRVNSNYAELQNRFLNEWNGALGQILYQGCGINVLQFLNKLEVTDARNRVLVLYKTGTSIFKFMDYLFALYPELQIDTLCAYTFNTANALKYLYDIKDIIKDNYVIPAKMYNNNDINDERGHYILFFIKSAPYEIFVIDPQSSKAETWDEYSKFYSPVRMTFIFFQTQQPYGDNNFLATYVNSHKATRLYRKATSLLWGGKVKPLREHQVVNRSVHLAKPEPVKTKSVKTSITSDNLSNLNKLKDKLINKLLVEIYCYDEFTMRIPEEEKKKFKRAKNAQNAKSAKKTLSKVSSIKSNTANKSRKSTRSNTAKTATKSTASI